MPFIGHYRDREPVGTTIREGDESIAVFAIDLLAHAI